jgi:hypothetical protein
MRDPDLVLRAQRAAATLERAWDRWRTMHGLGAGPLPPVSSYVGYSLEEPWGQPRVVFGVAAEEAEQIAALLDQQCYVGTGYGADPARIRVPAQGPVRAGDDARIPPREASTERAAYLDSADREAIPQLAASARLPGPAAELSAVPGPAPELSAVPGPAPELSAVPGPAPEPTAVPGSAEAPGPAPELSAVPGPAPEPTAVPGSAEAPGPAEVTSMSSGGQPADEPRDDRGTGLIAFRPQHGPAGYEAGGPVGAAELPDGADAGDSDGGEPPADEDAGSGPAASAQPATVGIPHSGARPMRAGGRKARQGRADAGRRAGDAAPGVR